MEFQDVVRRRKMVRTYADRPVDPALVDRALENATHAPSAGFSQGWAFLRLDNPEDVRRFWAASGVTEQATARDEQATWARQVEQAPRPRNEVATGGSRPEIDGPSQWLTGMMRAPVVIVPCSSKAAYLDRYAEPDKGWSDRDEERWPMPFWHLDAAMASLLILQTATDAGLGACFFGVVSGREPHLRAEFAIPDAHDPIGVITIGHRVDDPARQGATGSPSRRPRMPWRDVVHHGGWNDH